MNRIYRRLNSIDDWRTVLAEPNKQWKTGYSARAMAHSWSEVKSWPTEIDALWKSSANTSLHQPEPLLMLAEHQVKLPGSGFDSQNDLFVIAKSADGALISLIVEGKVDESFGPTIATWKVDEVSSPNRRIRLEGLCHLLGLESVPDSIRYQLLHRTASAMIEAQRYNATYAVMMVHSFSTLSIDKNWDDFLAFVALYKQTCERGQLIELGVFGGIHLLVGWAKGDSRYLTR
jgi:hypothetical protein